MARDENYTPLTRKAVQLPALMRVLYRFDDRGNARARTVDESFDAGQRLGPPGCACSVPICCALADRLVT